MVILTSPDPQNGGQFGCSVAASQDEAASPPFNNIVIGAFGEGSGHVYIYDRIHSTYLPTIHSPNPSNNGQFGFSVAGAKSNTLWPRVIIGAPSEGQYRDFQPGTYFGRAYVYDPRTGTEIGELASANPIDQGEFGYAVAVPTDPVPYPSNPIFPVVVGAPGERVGALSSAGHVYIYPKLPDHPFTSSMVPTTTIQSPHPIPRGNFGQSVAIDGRYLIVGAPNENLGTGYVHIYDLLPTYLNPRHIFTVQSPNPQSAGGSGSGFGQCVALRGSVMVVGSPNETVGPLQYGRAYIFDASTGQLAPHGTLAGTSGAPQNFGISVATDELTTLVAVYGGPAAAQRFEVSTGTLIGSLLPGVSGSSVADATNPIIGSAMSQDSGQVFYTP